MEVSPWKRLQVIKKFADVFMTAGDAMFLLCLFVCLFTDSVVSADKDEVIVFRTRGYTQPHGGPEL